MALEVDQYWLQADVLKVPRFKEFYDAARSWRRVRRIVTRIEPAARRLEKKPVNNVPLPYSLRWRGAVKIGSFALKADSAMPCCDFLATTLESLTRPSERELRQRVTTMRERNETTA
jgi:hypothetical protein